MKYGMPTLVEFDSIEENVIFAQKNNLDFIELNMDLPLYGFKEFKKIQYRIYNAYFRKCRYC